MRSRVRRSLVLVCSFLLVLPPGWCCHLVATACCQDPSIPDEAPAPVKHSEDCCCCPEKQAPETPLPVPKPARPTLPCKQPCCWERLPVTTLGSKTPTPDPGGVSFVMPAAEPILSTHLAEAASREVRDALPSLHVLHCVWRC
jgi:hypothetical protein